MRMNARRARDDRHDYQRYLGEPAEHTHVETKASAMPATIPSKTAHLRDVGGATALHLCLTASNLAT
jgi:hypothetical protein